MGELVLSPSQLTTYSSCNRKWWFEKVLRLRSPSTTAQQLGTTLHAVLERYLEADELGRTPAGDAVEIYPEGWDEAITPDESQLVQVLVSGAIEAGILSKEIGRKIEHQFWIRLHEDVWVMGYADALYYDKAVDHKTTTAFKWALTPKQLEENIQLLIATKVLMLLAERRGDNSPEKISVIHNYFLKNQERPKVKQVIGTVTPDEVEDFWQGLKVTALDMLDLRGSIRGATRWADVEGPENPAKTCNAYGGCYFKRVCTKSVPIGKFIKMQITPPWRDIDCQACRENVTPGFNSKGKPCAICDYKTKGENASKNFKITRTKDRIVITGDKRSYEIQLNSKPFSATREEDDNVSVFDDMAAKKALLKQAAAPAAVVPPAAATAVLQEAAPDVIPEVVAAPLFGQQEVPPTVIPGSPFATQPTAVPQPVVPPFVVTPLAPAMASVPQVAVPAPAPVSAAVIQAPATTPIQEPVKKRGAPPRTFTLLVDCLPLAGTPTKTVNLNTIYHRYAQQLAESKGKNFREINAFDRRDLMAAFIPAIIEAENLKGYTIYAVANSPDLNDFIDAIIPYATTVFRGIGR
jgi:hypothetical protein